MNPFKALVAATTLALAGTAAHAIDVSIDPRSTFLRTSDDPNAQGALVLSLADLGFSAGDTLVINSLGGFRPGGSSVDDNNPRLIGVFSSSSTLLGGSVLNRVPGAIDAGTDFTTPASFIGALPTDIAQDFVFNNVNAATVLVPTGALFLFVGVSDTFFGDNTDPNLDFGVRVVGDAVTAPIPEPSTWALMLAGLAAAAMVARRSGAARQQALSAA